MNQELTGVTPYDILKGKVDNAIMRASGWRGNAPFISTNLEEAERAIDEFWNKQSATGREQYSILVGGLRKRVSDERAELQEVKA
jgi:hypothetical protein